MSSGPTRPEQALAGGIANQGQIVRVGDTVRRPASPSSESLRALLRHLEDVGFDGAPRHLGTDELGRDVLSYVEGDVPLEPVPGWARSDDALASVAHLLRRYHEAVAGFDGSGMRWSTSVPTGFAGRLLCHNDPNLDNVVFRDGRAAALIDFDLASPGDPVWDAGLATRLWVPLRHPSDVDPPLRERVHERVRLFAEAYGLRWEERGRLVAAAARSHDWCYGIVSAGALAGRLGYAQYWTPAANARAERGRMWLAEHVEELARQAAAPRLTSAPGEAPG